MATTLAVRPRLAVFLAAIALTTRQAVAAPPEQIPTVVVHVTDYAHVSAEADGRDSKRASIYYERIIEYAAHTRGDLDQVLALALAHELGHLLLPDYSHTKRGLMRAARTDRIVEMPNLLPTQAATIRMMLIVEAARVRCR